MRSIDRAQRSVSVRSAESNCSNATTRSSSAHPNRSSRRFAAVLAISRRSISPIRTPSAERSLISDSDQ
ncbi:hypothetical protein BRD01_13470 [Halobacteriales archaeon QS_8_65_32]|nr:MAG: hypothetical protein BRD01_13470 [Halobacteriales archaeon QS_8_65_32]